MVYLHTSFTTAIVCGYGLTDFLFISNTAVPQFSQQPRLPEELGTAGLIQKRNTEHL